MIWGLLLVPTWLMAEGWQYLVEPHGVFAQLGLDSSSVYHVIFGPAGVVFVLALANAPYAYLTLSAALGGLGSQYGEARSVHEWADGDRPVVIPVLAPAVLASVALVFVETMSDYGVSSTLAFQSHFQMATYGIYEAISNLPAQFGVAGVLSLLLLLSAALPLALQSRVTRGHYYAILSGRTRPPATRHHLRRPARWATTTIIAGFFLLALGAPALGAFYGSFVSNLGVVIGAHDLTLNAYREVLSGSTAYGHVQVEGASGLAAPLLLSTRLAAIAATVTAVLGLAVARLLAHRRPGRFTKAGDLLLLGSITLPGIVLGAGYIYTFNLPIASQGSAWTCTKPCPFSSWVTWPLACPRSPA